jgi:hypothetical protein
MAQYLYDYYLLKKSGRYFGHINYTSTPVVFAFRKPKNIEAIRENLCHYGNYKVDDNTSNVYKLTFEKRLDIRKRTLSSSYEIERMGYFDMNLHVTLNNINVHIVDDVIEDDETNMYLMNCGTVMEPVFVNDIMIKNYLNRFIDKEKINDDK